MGPGLLLVGGSGGPVATARCWGHGGSLLVGLGGGPRDEDFEGPVLLV